MTPIEDDSISCKDHCICPPGTSAQVHCTAHRAGLQRLLCPQVAGLIIGGEVVKDLVGFVPLKGVKQTAASLPRGTIWNALRVALRIISGRMI